MLYRTDDRETAIDLYYERMDEVEVTTALTDLGSGETLYVVRDILKRTNKVGVPYHVWERAETPDFECDCDFNHKPCAHVGAVLIERTAQRVLEDIREAKRKRAGHAS